MAASTSTGTVSLTETKTEEPERSPIVRLKLKKPKQDKKVQWTQGTVDNEHMGKKKSKCCCIYEKPKLFGESSSESEDDDECGHCRGHKKKCYKQEDDQDGSDPGQGPSLMAS